MPDTFDRFQPRERGLFGDNELSPDSPTKEARSNLVDLVLTLRKDSPLSIAVTNPEDGANAKWIFLPKSEIEFEVEGTTVKVACPRWLAERKGLV